MTSFGASGPMKHVLEEAGLTSGKVLEAARRVLQGKGRSISSRAVSMGVGKRRKVAR